MYVQKNKISIEERKSEKGLWKRAPRRGVYHELAVRVCYEDGEISWILECFCSSLGLVFSSFISSTLSFSLLCAEKGKDGLHVANFHPPSTTWKDCKKWDQKEKDTEKFCSLSLAAFLAVAVDEGLGLSNSDIDSS